MRLGAGGVTRSRNQIARQRDQRRQHPWRAEAELGEEVHDILTMAGLDPATQPASVSER